MLSEILDEAETSTSHTTRIQTFLIGLDDMIDCGSVFALVLVAISRDDHSQTFKYEVVNLRISVFVWKRIFLDAFIKDVLSVLRCRCFRNAPTKFRKRNSSCPRF